MVEGPDVHAQLAELRRQGVELQETSRDQLASLQAGLAALTSTLDQREHSRREQSEQRLHDLRELQGALSSHRNKKRVRANKRPSTAQAADRSGRRRATRRPSSARSVHDRLALAVGGRKSARTVACATGAVKDLGRNSLSTSEYENTKTMGSRRSSSTDNRERPWREGGDLTVKPSAEEIVAASQVSDTRLISFNRRMATQSKLYKDVIARSDMDWDIAVARPQRAGRLANTAHALEQQDTGSINKILSTTDELLALESEITGRWRRSHCPKDGPVRLRPGGKSVMARSESHAERGSVAVLHPRQDTNLTRAAGASQTRSKAKGLKVEIPEYDGLDSDCSQNLDASPASVILSLRSEEKKQSEPESMLERWAQDRAVQSAKKKISQIAAQEESDQMNAHSNAKRERTARAERMFRDLDADNSGTLDRAELKALASALGTTLSDHEISEAMTQVDKDGDGSVNLEEFLQWYESNHNTPDTSPIPGDGTKNLSKKAAGKRLLAKLESFSAQLSSVTNEDVDMPHNFIWVHVDATARIQTLKVDSSRLDRQLVDTAILDKMHKEVLNSQSELSSMQSNMRTLRSSTVSQQERSSSSFAPGMNQADKVTELVEQLLGHASALLSKRLPAPHTLRGHRRSNPMPMDSDTKKASALLGLAKELNSTLAIKPTIWAGEASCLVRQGKPRAAMKLLRKCSAALKSHGASNVELSNGWLNESAAMSAAGDQAAALRCAEKSAAILHEDIEKFETSATVAGFFQRALITRDWLDTACLLCISLYAAANAHLAQGQRAPAVAALREAVAVSSKWLGPERPMSRVLTAVQNREMMDARAAK